MSLVRASPFKTDTFFKRTLSLALRKQLNGLPLLKAQASLFRNNAVQFCIADSCAYVVSMFGDADKRFRKLPLNAVVFHQPITYSSHKTSWVRSIGNRYSDLTVEKLFFNGLAIGRIP